MFDRLPESGGLCLARCGTAARTYFFEHFRQEIGIEQGRALGLDPGFDLAEECEQRLVAERDARPLAPGRQSFEDAALPIDQRAVTVEGQNVDIRESHDGVSLASGPARIPPRHTQPVATGRS